MKIPMGVAVAVPVSFWIVVVDPASVNLTASPKHILVDSELSIGY
jgi:hypothetical protein